MKDRFCFTSAQNIVLCLMLAPVTPPVVAQTIVAPAVSDSLPTGTTGSTQATSTAVDEADILSALTYNLPLWARGPVALRPRATYSAYHGTGIQVGPGQAVDTTTQTFAPGLLAQLGMHWSVDYAPAWTWYSNDRFSDTFDESVGCQGNYRYDRVGLTVRAGYGSTHPSLVETATQAHEVRLSTSAELEYRLTDRTQLMISAYQSYRRASSVASADPWPTTTARDWSSREQFRWQATELTTASGGVAFGYTNVSHAPGMSYIRPELALDWKARPTLSVDLQAGVERREFRREGVTALTNPVYSASVTYKPYQTTTITAGATQGIAASYLANSVTKSRAWRLDFRQRLLGFVYGGVSYSEQRSDFVRTVSNLPSPRGDRYSTFGAQVGVPVLNRGSISMFFQRSRNTSTVPGFGFTSRQVGIQLSYTF